MVSCERSCDFQKDGDGLKENVKKNELYYLSTGMQYLIMNLLHNSFNYLLSEYFSLFKYEIYSS